MEMLSKFVSRRLLIKSFRPRRVVNLQTVSIKTDTTANKTDAALQDTILVERDENVMLIGINRPAKRNAIDNATADQLSVALNRFEEDGEALVAVLYGVGGNFCAGYDVEELEKQLDKGYLQFLMRHEGSVGITRRHLRKPLVAAINGYCIATGLELALMCDLRVMEDTAVMGFSNRRFGVPTVDGGTVRLANMIGYSHALDLLMTGRRVKAKEAIEIGLIDRIVATGTSLGQSVNLAFSMVKYPQVSFLHDRNSLLKNAYSRQSFRQAIQNEVMNIPEECLKEIREGVQRFKQSETKGARTRSWNIKEKPLPDWEKSEVNLEKQSNGEQK